MNTTGQHFCISSNSTQINKGSHFEYTQHPNSPLERRGRVGGAAAGVCYSAGIKNTPLHPSQEGNRTRPRCFQALKGIRFLLFIVSFMFVHFCARAQQPRPKWVDDFKGNSGTSEATAVTVDQQNNVYVTGYFYGTVDFDPSSGIKNLTSVGVDDIFVGKYKSDGTLIWVESFGGTNAENPLGIAVDKDGNISIAGIYFSLIFDADPGPGVYDLYNFSVNNNNGFLVHLNPNGGFLWAHSLEANSSNPGTGGVYYGVATDSQDDVIVTTVVPALATVGDSTYKIATGQLVKYSASGNVLWSINFSQPTSQTTGSADALNTTTDNQDNIIVTGSLRGKVNFNPLGVPDSLTASGSTSAYYVAKYSSSGILIWGNVINNPASANFNAFPGICTDRQKNIYFTNTFYPSITFGSTVVNVTGNGTNECIAKYSSSGLLQFAEAVGCPLTSSSTVEQQNAIASDKNNNLYLTGTFFGTVNFDPKNETTGSLTAHGLQDFYVAKYDSLGNYDYAFSAGSPSCGNTYGYSLAIDTNNNIDVGGSFCSTVNFDPTGCSTTNVTATSGADPFLAQYATEALTANNVITPPSVSSFCTSGTPTAITGSLPTGGDGTYTYQWQSSADSVNFANISGATSQNYTPPTITATTYYQRIVNSGGCPSPPPALSSNIVKLTILPTLTAPVVTLAGTNSSTVIFTWTAVAGATGYQVSTDGGLIYSAHSGLTDTISNLQPGQSVTLIVQATSSIACQTSAASAPVTGMVPAGDLIYVANAFTPNADGRNDVLHVLGANIQTLKFYIYDQWGEQIFSSSSQQNGWDGTYKGTKEPVGVYVYYIEAVMNDGQNIKKKGTITLLK